MKEDGAQLKLTAAREILEEISLILATINGPDHHGLVDIGRMADAEIERKSGRPESK